MKLIHPSLQEIYGQHYRPVPVDCKAVLYALTVNDVMSEGALIETLVQWSEAGPYAEVMRSGFREVLKDAVDNEYIGKLSEGLLYITPKGTQLFNDTVVEEVRLEL